MLRAKGGRVRVTVAAGVVLAAALGPALLLAPPAWAGPQLNGGGSGFAGLEISQWRADTARKPLSLNMNYNATGSGDGRQNFATGLYDFAASDIPYPPTETALLQSTQRCGQPLANCFRYVPVSAGGLGFMYNLIDPSGNRVTNLQLTPDQVCRIYTGAIFRWNDPSLVQTNPFLSSFDRGIGVRTRADSAGESYVLSEFCIAVAPHVWSDFIAAERTVPNPDQAPDFQGGQPVSLWPTDGPGKATFNPNQYADGVASAVADPVAGRDSIGYVAAGYAKVRAFPVASVQNAAGEFKQPDDLNVTVALGYATGNGDGTFRLKYNGPDPRAYFPSTYSYVLAQTTGYDPAKGAAVGQFLCYAVGQGQTIAPQLRYARLSSAVVAISVDQISHIPGAPPASQCTAGAPPPPPPPSVLGGSSGTVARTGTATTVRGQTGTTAAGTGTTTATGVNGQPAGGVATGPGCSDATTTITTGSIATTTTTTSSTTVACANGPAAVIVGSPDATTLQSVPASSVSGPSNQEVLSTMLEGAVVCALGLAFVGRRKRGGTP